MKVKALPLLVILLLLALVAPALAQEATIPASAFSRQGLEASLGPTDLAFNESRASTTLSVDVRNPTNDTMDVYVALYQDRQWKVIKKLGSIGPGALGNFSYLQEFTYGGKTVEVDKLGIAGKTYRGYLGTAFAVTENWSRYEDALKSTLSFTGGLVSAFLLGVLVIVMAGVLTVAMHMRHGSEYTLRTLFFPIIKMRPWAERVADIVINPFFWVFELILGAVLVAIILWFTLHDIRPDIGWLVFLVGGVAAVFMPVIFLVLGWLADYYEREPFRFILGMFMWGVMATFFAFFINTTLSLLASLILGSGAAGLLVAIFLAPVVEETAKGTGLLILSGHHEYDNVFDGIIFGFAIGMGFAFIENWLYFATNASPVAVGGLGEWTFNILYRSFLCSLAHGCFTATTGAFIGYFKGRRTTPGFGLLGFFLGLPVAIFLHGLFNFTAVIDAVAQSSLRIPVPIFDPLLTIAVTVIYICIGAYLQLKMKKRLQAGS